MDGRVRLGTDNDVLLACTIGDLLWLKRGISNGIAPTTTNEEGLNGLHMAAKYGQVECMKYLLDTDSSIDVNCPSLSTGSSALHYSIANVNASKSIQCTKLLLSLGANLNCQNKLGETPLHIAAKCGHIKLVKLFLEMGASIQTKDTEGQTPYDTACVHNQHECARLLRALQWANKKDCDDRQKLRREEIKKRQTIAKIAIQKQLRKEAADASYNDWLGKKGMDQEGRNMRQESYSRPTLSSRGASRQSAKPKQKSSPQFTSTIKLNPKQAKRNLTSIGKPEKMQPYTNYPPKSSLRRTSVHYLSKSRSEPSKSGRSSRATVRSAVSVPAGMRYYSSKVHHRRATIQQQNDEVRTTDDLTEVTKESCESRDREQDTERDLSKEHEQAARQEKERTDRLDRDTCQDVRTEVQEQQLTVRDLETTTDRDENYRIQTVEEEDKEIETSGEDDSNNTAVHAADLDDSYRDENSYLQSQAEVVDELDFSKLVNNDAIHSNNEYSIGEEEDLFHDVGQTNSLNALSLPNTLTKDRTPAEIVQLLRSLGSMSRYNRSNSFSHTYSVAHRNRMQRRFSLGAIPEGKIVTSYSDDEQSTSQLLDNQFLESLIFNMGGDGRNENEDLHGLVASQKCIQEDIDDDEESLGSSDGSETLSGSTLSSSIATMNEHHLAEDDELCEHLGDLNLDLPQVEISQDDKPSPVSQQQSLKVVNLAWDPFSNTVQSHISESPLSPPDLSNRSGRWTPTRKLTPPNKDANVQTQSSQANSCSGSDLMAIDQFSSSHSPTRLTPSPFSSESSLHSQKRSKLTPPSNTYSKSDSIQPSESSFVVEEVETDTLTSIDGEATYIPSLHFRKPMKTNYLSSSSMVVPSVQSNNGIEGDNRELLLETEHETTLTECRRVKSAPNILSEKSKTSYNQ